MKGGLLIEDGKNITAGSIMVGNGKVALNGQTLNVTANLIEATNGDLVLTIAPYLPLDDLKIGELMAPNNNIIITFSWGTLSGIGDKGFRAIAKAISIIAHDGEIIADYIEATDGDVNLNIDSGSRSIRVGEIIAEGNIDITTSYAYINLGNAIAGGNINIESGAIENGITASTLRSINGNITAKTIYSDATMSQLDAENGEISLEVKGKLISMGDTPLVLKGKEIFIKTGSDNIGATIDNSGPTTLTIISDGSGNIFITKALGDLIIDYIVTDGNVNLSVGGDIRRKVESPVNPEDDFDIKASSLLANAGGSMGTAATEEYLKTIVGTLDAEALGGSIYIRNYKDMMVSKAVAPGHIKIYNEGKIESKRITAGGDIYFDATGEILIGLVDGDIGFIAGGNIAIKAGEKISIENIKGEGSISIDSKRAISLRRVESGSSGAINIKSNHGINIIAIEGDLANIIGGNLTMDAGTGALASEASPLRIKLADGAALSINSGGDLYLLNISEGHIKIDSIDAKGHISLKTAGGIKATSKEENITAKSLDIEGKYIGSSESPLGIRLDNGILKSKSIGGGTYIKGFSNLSFAIDKIDSAGDVILKISGGGELGIENLIAMGSISIDATGKITVEKVESTPKADINIKAADGIYVLQDPGGSANIIGGNLVLDGGIGSIGENASPIKIDLAKVASLRAISTGYLEDGELLRGDIFIENLSVNDLLIDYIKTPGKVTLITPSTGIRALENLEGENINAGDLDIDTLFIGDIVDGEAQYLKVRLTKPLNITAPGNIYVENMEGDLNIGTITKDGGDIYLKNKGNIYVNNIYAKDGSVNLTSKEGSISVVGGIEAGVGDIYLIANLGNISYNYVKAEGASIYLSAKALPIKEGSMMSYLTARNIHITITDGDITIGELETPDGDISLTASQGSIIIGSIKAQDGNVYLNAKDSIIRKKDSLFNEVMANSIYARAGEGDIDINRFIARSGKVDLMGGGNILVGTIEATADITLEAGGNIVLEVAQSTDGGVGLISKEGRIDVSSLATSGGTINLIGKNNVTVDYIDTENGDVGLISDSGDIIFAYIESKDGSVSLDAYGSILSLLDGPFTIVANDIKLIAVGGTIGVGGKYLTVKDPTIDTGLVSISTLSRGDTYIKNPMGSIFLDKMESQEGTIYLWIKEGIRSTGINEVDLKAKGLNIIASDSLGSQERYFNAKIDFLEAQIANGGLYLNNMGHMVTNGIDVGGHVYINTTGNLSIDNKNSNLDNGLVAGGKVVLTSSGDMLIDTIKADDEILLEAQGTININKLESATRAPISITSKAGNINGTPQTENSTNITGGNLTLKAGKGSLGTVDSPIKIFLSMDATINALSNSDIYLRNIGSNNMYVGSIIAPGHVYLSAGRGIRSSGQANIEAGSLEIEGEFVGDKYIPLRIAIEKVLKIKAQGDIYIDGKGDYSISSITTGGGSIRLINDGNLTIDLVETGEIGIYGEIYIEAHGIGAKQIKGADGKVTLISKGDLEVNDIKTANGGIYLASTDGNLTVGLLETANGSIDLESDKDIRVDSITSKDGHRIYITGYDNSYGPKEAGSIEVASIKTDSSYIMLNSFGKIIVNSITNTEGPSQLFTDEGDITVNYIHSVDGDIAIMTSDGNLIIGQIETQNGEVLLMAGGSITGRSTNSHLINIKAEKAEIIVFGDLGSKDSPINTNINSLEIKTKAGDIWLNNQCDIEIIGLETSGDIMINNKGHLTIVKDDDGKGLVGGKINIQAEGGIIVSADVLVDGKIVLIALDSGGKGNNIIIKADNIIQSKNGRIWLGVRSNLGLDMGTKIIAEKDIVVDKAYIVSNTPSKPDYRDPGTDNISKTEQNKTESEETQSNKTKLTIPPMFLLENITLSVIDIAAEKALELPEVARISTRLSSGLVEILSEGISDFGKDNFIEVEITIDESKIAPGETPVIHAYNELTGEWQPIKTKIELNSETKGYVVKGRVNHSGKYAVLSSKIEKKNIILEIEKAAVSVDDREEVQIELYIDSASSRTMAPVRYISEAMGADVEWIGDTRQVIIRKNDRKIVLTVGSRDMLVDGVKYILDTDVVIGSPGTCFVPVRFIAEALGASVDYDESSRKVDIIFDSIEVEDLRIEF